MDSAPLPLAISLADRRCVCVGGGSVAARRVPLLLEAGARVTVIAPHLRPLLSQLHAAGRFEHVPLRYALGDLAGAYFVLAATGDPDVDAAVAAEARECGALVSVAGVPALGTCQFMATVRRGPLLVGVHTAGVAPAMSVALRRHLERALPANLEELLAQVGELRLQLRVLEPDPRERARRWQDVAETGALDALLAGADPSALETIRDLLLS